MHLTIIVYIPVLKLCQQEEKEPSCIEDVDCCQGGEDTGTGSGQELEMTRTTIGSASHRRSKAEAPIGIVVTKLSVVGKG